LEIVGYPGVEDGMVLVRQDVYSVGLRP